VRFLIKHIVILFIIFSAFKLFSQTDIYWESDELVASGNIGRFEVFNNNNLYGIAYADIEKKFALNIKYSTDGLKWSQSILAVKNFFSNNALGVDFSTVVDQDNNLFICYRMSKNQFILVQMSYPYKEGASKYIVDIKDDKLIFLPKLFIDSKNNLHLVYASSVENSFIIKYKKITRKGDLLLNEIIGSHLKSALNPVIKEFNGNIYIAFQAKDSSIESGYYYNIVLAVSSIDSTTKWRYYTVVKSGGENNQSPDFTFYGNKILLVWEKDDKNFISHIYYKSIELNRIESLESKDLLISNAKSEAHSPRILLFNDNSYIFWYDNADGDFQNYQCQIINDEVVDQRRIIKKNGRTLSNYQFIYKDSIKFLWLQNAIGNSIYMLKTDSSVEAPKVIAYGINDAHYTNRRSVKFIWNEIIDKSGIKGYRAILTKNKDEKIRSDIPMIFYKDLSKTYDNIEDGIWYFKIKSYDNAGNESIDTVYSFTVDTVKPDPPRIISEYVDKNESLPDNSPIIEWIDSNKPLSAYKYFYRFFPNVSEVNADYYKSFVRESDFNYTTDKLVKFNNLENGILLFGVKGIDKAGNESGITWTQFKLDKYIVETSINYVASTILKDGSNGLEIYGKGFKTGGIISEIYISKSKNFPYDYKLDSSYFNVESDRYIVQTKDYNIKEGDYYIGIKHSQRGILFYNIKTNFSGRWLFYYDKNASLNIDKILYNKGYPNLTSYIILIISILWIFIVIFLFRSVILVIKEKIYLNQLIMQLDKVKMELSQKEYIERREKMIKKGMGLTFKYTILILSLVITVVLATSITLSALALKNETVNLANEMKERANLVMRNYITTMVDIYTYEKGFSEAVDATANITTLPDIGFALFREPNNTTIIRYGDKYGVFFKGVSIKNLNDEEKTRIILQKVFNKESNDFLNSVKNSMEDKELIMPPFDPSKLNDKYIFIKPIIIKQGESMQYVAEIVLGYSFEKILTVIKRERINLITTALIVTIIAILISIFGSVFLAATTIRPIKRMSKHVNVISLTDDYEKLLGTENEKINVTSNDEIGILASSINDMTEKLIEKAKADKQMMLGKEIQKKFISLEPHVTDYIDIYGFYEGAKGVSGDYFDYKKLDDNNYAFIICDVAGKAVPAALIMVQISTLFHSFCTNFDPRKDKIDTVSIINTINDTVAERGFVGRFAAILVVILNIKTRKALMTNAGYTQVLIYRNSKQKTEWVKLNEAGAAGVFPSYMLPEPYKQEELQLDHGDIIYLFTDGIEEARNGKMIRDEKGEEKPEEFGDERIRAVLDKSGDKTPKEMIERLIAEESRFRGDFEQYDDLTILGIKVK